MQAAVHHTCELEIALDRDPLRKMAFFGCEFLIDNHIAKTGSGQTRTKVKKGANIRTGAWSSSIDAAWLCSNASAPVMFAASQAALACATGSALVPNRPSSILE
jgi:hypothetical protein